jgi:predicted transcriptional regulator
MVSKLDLTPFGFTPTESAAYRQLIEDGPSSGYAVAKRLAIARANAYQALDGLVAKNAADVVTGEPRTYRAIQPQALLAMISRDLAAGLDTLEGQLVSLAEPGAPGTVAFSGDAEFNAVLMRSAIRPPAMVEFLAPSSVFASTVPVWRTRYANGRPTGLWCIGQVPEDFPVPAAITIDPASVRRLGGEPLVLITPNAALLGRLSGAGPEGHWTSDPVLMLGARGIMAAVQPPRA